MATDWRVVALVLAGAVGVWYLTRPKDSSSASGAPSGAATPDGNAGATPGSPDGSVPTGQTNPGAPPVPTDPGSHYSNSGSTPAGAGTGLGSANFQYAENVAAALDQYTGSSAFSASNPTFSTGANLGEVDVANPTSVTGAGQTLALVAQQFAAKNVAGALASTPTGFLVSSSISATAAQSAAASAAALDGHAPAPAPSSSGSTSLAGSGGYSGAPYSPPQTSSSIQSGIAAAQAAINQTYGSSGGATVGASSSASAAAPAPSSAPKSAPSTSAPPPPPPQPSPASIASALARGLM